MYRYSDDRLCRSYLPADIAPRTDGRDWTLVMDLAIAAAPCCSDAHERAIFDAALVGPIAGFSALTSNWCARSARIVAALVPLALSQRSLRSRSRSRYHAAATSLPSFLFLSTAFSTASSMPLSFNSLTNLTASSCTSFGIL